MFYPDSYTQEEPLIFRIMPVFFVIIFIVIIGAIIYSLVLEGRKRSHDNNSPILDVAAKVVAKRTEINYRNSDDSMNYSRTKYYVTFEVASKDRMEFGVEGTEYGKLVEGDVGMLKFQGTRYLGFTRSDITF